MIHKRRVKEKIAQKCVVVVFSDKQIDISLVRTMLNLSSDIVVRIVVYMDEVLVHYRICAYAEEIGVDKRRGDKIFLYKKGEMIAYDCCK